LDRYREDERERQRKCRQARREELGLEQGAGAAEVDLKVCHAPPSLGKYPEFQEKVLKTWDELVALSRATLVRGIKEIFAEMRPSGGKARGPERRCHAPP
jgi:hypothetical protein